MKIKMILRAILHLTHSRDKMGRGEICLGKFVEDGDDKGKGDRGAGGAFSESRRTLGSDFYISLQGNISILAGK